MGANLAARIVKNEQVLVEAYKSILITVGEHPAITPATECLIENFYIAEEQRRFSQILSRWKIC